MDIKDTSLPTDVAELQNIVLNFKSALHNVTLEKEKIVENKNQVIDELKKKEYIFNRRK